TEFDRIKNSSRLSDWSTQAEAALLGDDESALVRLHRVIQKGSELKKYDSSIEERLKILSEAKSLIEEFVYDLRGYTNELESSPEALETLEARISDLRKLQKKYGNSVEDILSAYENIEKELNELENSDQRLVELKKEHAHLFASLTKLAETLHKKREAGASLLADSVNGELKDLNMKGVVFLVRAEKMTSLSATGLSEVEFMIKPSAKDAERAISKIASGGELSRILLSLKNVTGVGDYPRSYLFDEVDTGVSGPT